MAEKEEESGEESPGFLKRIFSKIGNGIIKTGEVTKKAPSSARRPKEGESSSKEEVPLSERLQEIKKLETQIEEEDWKQRGGEVEEEEKGGEEKEEWEEEREELEKPASQRIANIFSGIFSGPAESMSGFFTFSGLQEDLHRANMNLTEQQYISMLLGIGLIVSISTFVAVWFILGSIFLSIILSLVGSLITILVGRNRPRSRIKSRASEVNQDMPYALRHMATQLSSGIGLPETLTSVSEAGYGVLSEEFERTLQDMRMGKSMTEALGDMQKRVGSDPLKRTVRQIQRTLRTGGDLSKTLDILASEASVDLRMNLRDYTQSLNVMTMVYMFSSAVIPSLLVVIIIITNFIGSAFLPTPMVVIMYLFGIPFLLFYMVMVFRRMEPEV